MRISVAFCLVVLAAGPAAAQSLDGSLRDRLSSSVESGLNGGIPSGLASTLGSSQMSGTLAITTRRGIDYGGCAPGQVEINHTGCRPLRELGLDFASSYDRSIQGMGPLQDLTLQGLTLDPGAGPAGPD